MRVITDEQIMTKTKARYDTNRIHGDRNEMNLTGALNGGTLSLFFNENKKETLEYMYLKPSPENKMKNIY